MPFAPHSRKPELNRYHVGGVARAVVFRYLLQSATGPRREFALTFIHDDFLLQTDTARRLYHDYAAKQAIIDYHSHLPAGDIATQRQFHNLTEIWLEGDHYKWRAMRANGIEERYCTGNASPQDKFRAWARTVPQTLRNPLYHWTHLELKRYFEIDSLLNEQSAEDIWNQANFHLASGSFNALSVLNKFNVKVLCTSDDPCDDLRSHAAINALQAGVRVYPTFRPDRALIVDQPTNFNEWVRNLEEAANLEVTTIQNLCDALRRRHDHFHTSGGRLSDHGLPYCYARPCTERRANEILQRARRGHAATPEEHDDFASYLMLFLGHLDSQKGWTKQLHLGALRAVNTSRVRDLGVDSGFDAIGDWPQAEAFCAYLDALEREDALPKIVVYNLNPADNYLFATAIGSFQDGRFTGKIQFGSGWWFLDQKEGIEWQINALSNAGLLSRFVGMVTDSRSFMSFPRHEYFRRVLCNVLGEDIEKGLLPKDDLLLGALAKNICFENARTYLGLELPPDLEKAR
jgi:glucuronate isomerase